MDVGKRSEWYIMSVVAAVVAETKLPVASVEDGDGECGRYRA